MRFHLPCSGRWPGLLTLSWMLLFSGLSAAIPPAARAESVNVIKPWVKVLAAPKTSAKPVALAYGNDNYEVIEDQGGWVKIRTRHKAAGWVSKDDVHAVVDPIAARSLAFALELKNAGKEREARAKLFEVVTRFPGTFQSYEATRHLLTWHNVGQLPEPQDRKIAPKDKREAERLASWMMVLEGRAQIGEKRYPQAVAMFEEARKRGTLNRSAMDGIRAALQADHREANQAGDKPRAEMTLMALKSYFPTAEHPESFKLETFARPPVTEPSLSPLVPPPPAIPEEDALPPSTHDFERKELELAPVPDNNLPAPPSQAPPAPEANVPEHPQSTGPAPQPNKPELMESARPQSPESAPPKEARPEEPNKKTDAPKAPQSAAPKKKEPDNRLKAKKPAQQAALPRRQVSPAPAEPRDTPPGFPAQAETPAPQQETALHGLWPILAESRPAESRTAGEPPRVSVDKRPGFAVAPKHGGEPVQPAGNVPASGNATASNAAAPNGSRGLWAVAVQSHIPPPPPALSDLNERPAMSSPGPGR